MVAAVVGVTYRRLYDGIDFTDESYYVVLPYRLVLGARPFVDETSGGLDKLAAAVSHQGSTFRFWYLVLPALALLALAWRRRRATAAPLLLVLPLLVWPPKEGFYTASLEYVVHYGLLALPLCVLGILLFTGIPVYRDGAADTLRARVHGGAYAGLLTSARKRAFLTLLRRDLAASGPRCRILFFADFPAGYLLTRARPDTNGAWTATVAPADVPSYQGALLACYRRHGFPDVVVLMRRIPYAAPTSARIERYRQGEPLLAMLRQRSYRLVAGRLDYAVYRATNGLRC